MYDWSSINPNAQSNSIYHQHDSLDNKLELMCHPDVVMTPNWIAFEFKYGETTHDIEAVASQYAESGDGPWVTLNEWTALNSSGWQYSDIITSLAEYEDYPFCKLYINSTYLKCQVWSNEVQINFGVIKIYSVSLRVFALYSSIMIYKYK